MDVVPRPHYLDALIQFRDTEALVKVISGVRRCGKSSLLALYRDYLLDDGVQESSILTLNFESLELSHIVSALSLNDHVAAHKFDKGKRYIFLDEVQLVPGWEQAVNSLRLDQRNDIYVTGSNSRLLSSNLASLLSGRYVQIEVFPLSFAEYCAFRGPQATVRPAATFNDYLVSGGLPGLFSLLDEPVVRTQYIDAVLNTIITKDIVTPQEVRDVDALLKIIRYLTANVGNLITAKGVADYLRSSGGRISNETVDNYLTLLEEAYLFYRARREDVKDKSIMKTNDKFYVVDLGFRTVTQGMGLSDLGRVLENVVYFELLRRYSTVSVGKFNAEEIDFVAFCPVKGTAYFQVALTMNDETIRNRELRPLIKLNDSYPKTVLSLDEVRTPDFNGIRHENLVDWCLRESG